MRFIPPHHNMSKAVSDFHWLKIPPVPSVALVAGDAASFLKVSRGPGSAVTRWPTGKDFDSILYRPCNIFCTKSSWGLSWRNGWAIRFCAVCCGFDSPLEHIFVCPAGSCSWLFVCLNDIYQKARTFEMDYCPFSCIRKSMVPIWSGQVIWI